MLQSAPLMGKLGQYFMQTFGRFKFEGLTLTPPTKTFASRLEMKVGNKDVELIEVGPAHTGGDVMVYLPGDKVLFSGDIVLSAAGPVSWEGPLKNMLKALDLILSLDIEVLVPGHGPLADKSAARENKDYWEYTAIEARRLYDQGVPAAEAAITLSSEGRYTSEHQAVLNMINTHMLYRDFSGDEAPSDKAVVLGHIAEIMIPN